MPSEKKKWRPLHLEQHSSSPVDPIFSNDGALRRSQLWLCIGSYFLIAISFHQLSISLHRQGSKKKWVYPLAQSPFLATQTDINTTTGPILFLALFGSIFSPFKKKRNVGKVDKSIWTWAFALDFYWFLTQWSKLILLVNIDGWAQ